MTKYLLFCSLVLIICSKSNLYAQNFKFGIQTGINVSNIHVTNNSTRFFEDPIYTRLILNNINGYLSLKINTNWGISIEPGFIQKGGNRVPITQYDPFETKNLYSYIQLPVLSDLYLFKNFCFSIGPEFAYLVKARTKTSFSTEDIYDQCKKFEISGLIGLYYNIFKIIDVGFRYSHGLSSTNRNWLDDFGTFIGQTTEYNHYLQFTLRLKK